MYSLFYVVVILPRGWFFSATDPLETTVLALQFCPGQEVSGGNLSPS